ncbi:tRNA (adenosine(37)-N6)-dimethylallyltransferase MiaA [Ignavigranum ruoffiae]
MISTYQIPVVVLAGPTGVGKTAFSLKIAHHFNGEVINADSMQFYRGLDIGTGKIMPTEMDQVPHHLLDILEPDQSFDVSAFVEQAHQKIIEISARQRLPIIVGGSGLYIEALLYPLELGLPGSNQPEIRQALEQELEKVGPTAFWQRLNEIDPQAAKKIPQANTRRMIRAMEVIRSTGQLFSDQRGHQQHQARYQHCLIVLDRPRAELYERINHRVLQMINQGLVEEVSELFSLSQGSSWQSLQGIGYKEWLPFFNHEKSQEEIIQDIQQHSRRYAKRQLTWFRNRFKDKHWLEIDDEQKALDNMLTIIQNDLEKGDESGR